MSMMRKLRKSIKGRGISGTVWLVAKTVFGGRKPADPDEIAFDQRYGTDTGGYISVADLDVSSPTWVNGTAYQGVGPATDFRNLLPPIRFQDYTFVDLGSGKGRACLLAASLPFRQVIGVEFSMRLHAISMQNLNRWTEPHAPIKFVCADAGSCAFPPGPLVVFLYNPFDAELMRLVAARVAMHRDRVIVVYVTPHHPAAWDDFFTRISTQPGCITWSNQGESANVSLS
jgi:SAM-dependent methyltransferase